MRLSDVSMYRSACLCRDILLLLCTAALVFLLLKELLNICPEKNNDHYYRENLKLLPACGPPDGTTIPHTHTTAHLP